MERLSEFSDMSKDISPIVAVSKEMKKALSLAEKVANFQATVLILGESGVGKEEIAKFIHKNSMPFSKAPKHSGRLKPVSTRRLRCPGWPLIT